MMTLVECGHIARSLGFQQAGDVYLHQVTLLHRRLGVPLELHFALFHWLSHRERVVDQMWKHRQWLELDGVQIPVMSVEDQLVFGLAHIIAHGYHVSLKQYLDLLGLLVLLQSEIDLARVFRVLSLCDLQREFVDLCSLLSTLLGVPADIEHGRREAGGSAAFKASVVDFSADVGFVNAKKAGGESDRQAGLARRTRFLIRRLVPPVAALQVGYALPSRRRALWMRPYHVGYALPSRRRALWMRPYHVWATLMEVRSRKNTEVLVFGKPGSP